MVAPSQTTIRRKRPPCTWCFTCRVAPPSLPSASRSRNTTATRRSAARVRLARTPRCQVPQEVEPHQQPAPQEEVYIRLIHRPFLCLQGDIWPEPQGPWASIKFSFHCKPTNQPTNEPREIHISPGAKALTRSTQFQSILASGKTHGVLDMTREGHCKDFPSFFSRHSFPLPL